MYNAPRDPNLILNEITTFDDALTGPWTVTKKYFRNTNPRHNCSRRCARRTTRTSTSRNDNYMLSAEGLLMPSRKGRKPPDLRHSNRPRASAGGAAGRGTKREKRRLRPAHRHHGRAAMLTRNFIGAVRADRGGWRTAMADAQAFDDAKYPRFQGLMESRRAGRAALRSEQAARAFRSRPRLTPEFQSRYEASLADQATADKAITRAYRVPALGHAGDDERLLAPGIEFRDPAGDDLYPDSTTANDSVRRIFTDGRDFPNRRRGPPFVGYSIGKWIDTDADGRIRHARNRDSQFQKARASTTTPG